MTYRKRIFFCFNVACGKTHVNQFERNMNEGTKSKHTPKGILIVTANIMSIVDAHFSNVSNET